MPTLYLIRHTKPDIAPGICYGQLDPDVAGSFETEAHDIQRCLPQLERIIASPLLRARRLGEFLARAQRCELHSDARLMEKHFGAWEGKNWDDIPHHEIAAWDADIMGHAPPGGESAAQLMRRVRAFLLDAARLPQRNVAIIAHGGSIRALLALLADMPLEKTLRWEIGYGAVIGVRIKSSPTRPLPRTSPCRCAGRTPAG